MSSFEQQPRKSRRRIDKGGESAPVEQREQQEVSGTRERPKDPEETVQGFLFQSQQYGDETKMLAKEILRFQENGLMTPAGLDQYRSRLSQLVDYLGQAVAYGERVIASGMALRSMDQLKDGVIHNQEIIARAKEALSESQQLEARSKLPKEKELYTPRSTSNEEMREASPWTKTKEETPVQQPKKSFWSKLNPKSWFKKS